jgi:RsiW-degrading membrane proteinase PrsW (M82 family)
MTAHEGSRGGRARLALQVAVLAGIAVLLTFLDTLWFGPRLAAPSVSAGAAIVAASRLAAVAWATMAALPLIGIAAILARRTGLSFSVLLIGWLAIIVVLAAEAGRMHSIAEAVVGPPGPSSFDTAFVVWGPLIEEGAKVAAILIAARIAGVVIGVRQGILLGLAVGIGFTAAEVGLYAAFGLADGQSDPIATAVAVRVAFGGFGLHAATAALLGAAIGLRQSPAVATGLVIVAVATHAIWNLVGPSMFETVGNTLSKAVGSITPLVLWVASLPVACLLVGPAAVVLLTVWRRDRRAHDLPTSARDAASPSGAASAAPSS